MRSYRTAQGTLSSLLDHDGTEYQKGNVYICMTESLCRAAVIGTTLKTNYNV